MVARKPHIVTYNYIACFVSFQQCKLCGNNTNCRHGITLLRPVLLFGNVLIRHIFSYLINMH
jgi:hypothetical protein